MEKKYPIDDWSNYIPQMSNIQDRTGISIEWQKLWAEIENWYGDPKKHETGEHFLKRMQATYFRPPAEAERGKGAVWVKASERLPGLRTPVKWRQGEIEMKVTPVWYMVLDTNSEYLSECEWLDESGQ